MIKCTQCGSLNPDKAAFCSSCGQPFAGAAGGKNAKTQTKPKPQENEDGWITNAGTKKNDSGAITNYRQKPADKNSSSTGKNREELPRVSPNKIWEQEQQRLAAERARKERESKLAELTAQRYRLAQQAEYAKKQCVEAEKAAASVNMARIGAVATLISSFVFFILLLLISNGVSPWYLLISDAITGLMALLLPRPFKPNRLLRFILSIVTFQIFSVVGAIITLCVSKPANAEVEKARKISVYNNYTEELAELDKSIDNLKKSI